MLRAKKIKWTLPALLPVEAFDLVRRAVAAQTERWNVERELEVMLDRDFSNSEDLIKELTFGCDTPEDALKLTEATIREQFFECLDGE